MDLCLILNPLIPAKAFIELVQMFEVWSVPLEEPVTWHTGDVLKEWNVIIVGYDKKDASEHPDAEQFHVRMRGDWIDEPVEGFVLNLPPKLLEMCRRIYHVESVEVGGEMREVLRTLHYDFDYDFHED